MKLTILSSLVLVLGLLCSAGARPMSEDGQSRYRGRFILPYFFTEKRKCLTKLLSNWASAEAKLLLNGLTARRPVTVALSEQPADFFCG